MAGNRFGGWRTIKRLLAEALSWTGTQTFTTVDINGGAIDATTIGATTPAAITGALIKAVGTAGANGVLQVVDGDGLTVPISIEAELTSAGYVDLIFYSYINSVKTEIWRMDASDGQIEPALPMLLGLMSYALNSGIVVDKNMPISSASAITTPHGYDIQIGGLTVRRIYAQSDGAGSVQNRRTYTFAEEHLVQPISATHPISAVHGGFVRKVYYATSGTFTAAETITIATQVPSGARILGVQLHVKVALTAGETWDAAYDAEFGSVAIASAQAVAKNTDVNLMTSANAASDLTTGVVDILITKNGGGAFSAAGEIEAVVYAETFDAWTAD